MVRLLILLLTVMPDFAFAATGTSGVASVNLSKRLLCYTFTMFDPATSSVGIIIGLVVALFGLWTIIKGSIGWGIAFILAGAAVPFVPQLVASTLSGVQSAVSGMSTGGTSVWNSYGEIMNATGSCDEAFPVDMSAYEQQMVMGPNGQMVPQGTYLPGTGGNAGGVRGTYGNDQQGGFTHGVTGGGEVTTGRMTEAYGACRGSGCSRGHGGVDIAAPLGTPINAFDGGVVEYAGFANGYGNIVQIRHPDGTSTAYAHMQGFNVQAGQTIAKGQQIGGIGRSGTHIGNNAANGHLHFEMRDANNNQLNPCLRSNVCKAK